MSNITKLDTTELKPEGKSSISYSNAFPHYILLQFSLLCTLCKTYSCHLHPAYDNTDMQRPFIILVYFNLT